MQIVTPLAIALGREIDTATWGVYYAGLRDTPEPILRATVEAMATNPDGRKWFPTLPEMKAAVRDEQRRVLAAHPYEGCIDCQDSRGLIEVTGDDGIKRAQPCPCKARWRTKLVELGVGTSERIALPAARHWTDPESAA